MYLITKRLYLSDHSKVIIKDFILLHISTILHVNVITTEGPKKS